MKRNTSYRYIGIGSNFKGDILGTAHAGSGGRGWFCTRWFGGSMMNAERAQVADRAAAAAWLKADKRPGRLVAGRA